VYVLRFLTLGGSFSRGFLDIVKVEVASVAMG
jgi:hypothetical protein